MNKKSWSKFYLILLTIVTVCAVLYGITRHVFNLFRFSAASVVSGTAGDMVTEQINYFEDDVTSLSFDMSMSNVTVKYGDEVSIDYSFPKNLEPTVKLKNGKLTITQPSNNKVSKDLFNKDFELTVTIPKDSDLNDINISTNMGDLEFKDIVVSDSIKLSADMGNIDIKNISAKSITVDVNMGNIDLKNITCDSVDARIDMGNCDVDGDFEKCDAHSSMGNVDVDCSNPSAEIDADTDLGNCSVNGKKIKD